MPDPEIQDPPPPTYEQATGSSNASNRLQVPDTRSHIPPLGRRSMEDEGRPLPDGWIRLYDNGQEHQFFVDTHAKPPRSIWHHPYDDEQYLSSLTSEERERIEEQARVPPRRDTDMASTDEESPVDAKIDSKGKKPKVSMAQPIDTSTGEGPSSPQVSSPTTEKKPIGRKLKDKLTGTTHEQRVQEREQRAREEEQQYREWLAMRGAMRRAYQTGQPQLLGRDRDGKEVYMEPPGPPGMRAYAGPDGRYINPYSQGPYANPNARFIRPADPYSRPYGSGYGGIGLPLAGGIAGGLLLGGALGGFGL